jgi:uncharacterized protein
VDADAVLASTPAHRQPPRPLGIGFPYIAELPAELYRSGLMDFVEVTPEELCRELWKGDEKALALVPAQLDRALETCAGLPSVVHGVELSIGSVDGWNAAYVSMLDELRSAWPFRWHSEHLGFQTVTGAYGTSLEIGVPLPLPCTAEAAALVIPRAAVLGARYGVPFLLENPAHYFRTLPCDPQIGGEIGLMNRIVRGAQCWQLLDLHNLYCNAVNFGHPVRDLLHQVDLERVVEIHVAGGSWFDGYYMDGHDGRVPEPVWELLEEVLERARNVAGVVFEVLSDIAPRLGTTLIAGELERARRIWRAHRAQAGSEARRC